MESSRSRARTQSASMGRDNAESVHRATRRQTRWQHIVKVEPLQRAMAKVKATTSFKIRNKPVGARLESAIWAKFALNRWVLKTRFHYHVTMVANNFDHGYLKTSALTLLSMVLRNPKISNAAAPAFLEWLSLTVHRLTLSQSQKVPTGHRDPRASRLHLTGRGKVGKNFPMIVHQHAAYNNTRSAVLAWGLCHSLTSRTAHPIPSYIVRQAIHHSSRKRSTILDVASSTSQSTEPVADEQQDPHSRSGQKVCHFLNLPAELRNTIYEYALAYNGDIDSNGEVNLLTSASPTSALPQTCKQIGEECGLMYFKNFRNFWNKSNFYIDASSAFETGWHVRSMILRLPDREIQKVTNLRIAVVAKNGIYNAVMQDDHWLVQRVGGPDPAGRGVTGRRVRGADDIVIVVRYEARSLRWRSPSIEYVLLAADSTSGRPLRIHQGMLASGLREPMQLRGQIAAIIETLHRWI